MLLNKEKIIFEEELCTGCSCCELACSFHLKQQFSPGESAITIIKGLNQGSPLTCHISGDCDICPDLEQPACVKSCWPGALQLGRKV